LVNSGAGLETAPGAGIAAFTQFPMVYGNPQGDGDVLLKLLASLAARDPLSPTQFHNSVHNAPSGYWCIGNKVQAPSTAIAAGDVSLATCLVEAAVQAQSARTPVLLVVCDRPHSGPLAAVTPAVEETTTAALVVPADHPAAAWRCSLVRGAVVPNNASNNTAARATQIIDYFVADAGSTQLWLAPFNAALHAQRLA
jgi:Beta-ketoacyl synthase, N-terminal domain